MRAGLRGGTATPEDAAHGGAGKKRPGMSFPAALQSPGRAFPARPLVAQLTEEPEKGACGVSPTVTQSKAGEGPGKALRTNRPQIVHDSIFKLHLLEYYLISRSK